LGQKWLNLRVKAQSLTPSPLNRKRLGGQGIIVIEKEKNRRFVERSTSKQEGFVAVSYRLGQTLQKCRPRTKHQTLVVKKKWLVHRWRIGKVYSAGRKKIIQSLSPRQNHQSAKTALGWRFWRVCYQTLEKARLLISKTSEWVSLIYLSLMSLIVLMSIKFTWKNIL
jgi:hypothetical protein